MNNIKSVFTISDLENLTGISAHTIRIWERRYSLLSPVRTDTNIRRYSNHDLRKLLNIAALQQHGERISRLALMSEQELGERICDLYHLEEEFLPSINDFKLAMVEFDHELFDRTYARLAATMSFPDIYQKVMIPLLTEIGKFWQTGSICPAHEHFISNLIRQKLYSQIEMLPPSAGIEDDEWVRVLFLPPNEMHEIGALFLHYLIVSKGKNSIYLGQSVETEDLVSIRKAIKSKIIYISWWTIYPEQNEVGEYIREFSDKILKSDDQLWLTGNQLSAVNMPEINRGILVFNDPVDLVNKIYTQSN